MNSALDTNWPQQNREAVDKSRRITQYCQLPGNFPALFGIFPSFTFSGIFIWLAHGFSRKPKQRSTELWSSAGFWCENTARGSPEILRILLKRKIYYHFHKGPLVFLNSEQAASSPFSLSFFLRSALLLLSNLLLGLPSVHFRSCFFFKPITAQA